MNRFSFLASVFVGYALFFLIKFAVPVQISIFLLGLFIGYTFHILDRFFQLFLISELKSERDHFISQLKSRKVLIAFQSLVEKVPSVTSTFYFLVLYFPLAIYVTTSSGSILGTGLVLGLGLSYTAHFILGYKHISSIRQLSFQPVSKSVSDDEVKKIMGGFILAYIVFSLFVLF